MTTRELPSMMACGHVANGKNALGDPVCLIDIGIDPGAQVVVGQPDLTGRRARCGVDHGEVDSSFDLAFFEYRGEGSPAATRSCGNCGYFEEAHDGKKEGKPHLQRFVCDSFEPKGAWDFDLYYCGCRGWD